ncbi:septal ring lytic transglycosylase RlpA family protein [Crenobacter sp. SG2303]|uniref:Endolytic peptidoglycan transglycosylase RlpA n=1 Tax=Crenobacter oryzisoli TaxID=3056844 RepID=A0ABT7XML2_9NEIS|nr:MULTISPECIES: septal ring lytic transglycosylase RlpA family protein [unclassified Crenobacter]MDN0074975.1 septal ring lytic transglycosylase RlpA family protein [Crenobacter sp. SG2303]MDN0081240.1 septal ring lytic transglycosylase RlpA family protein [Crenobacter sp. SG2305]
MQPVLRWLWLAFISLVLVACSTVKPASATSQQTKKVANRGGYFQKDGPAAHIPVNLELVPDAVPQNERLIPSANRPYTAMGMSFHPDTSSRPYTVVGLASWYGKQFHGRKTTSGERYDMFAMTAAHPTLPIPSYVRVTNLVNGKEVIVKINDRGPFHPHRIMDMSYAAAYKLGFVKNGSAKVRIERVWPAAGGEAVANNEHSAEASEAKPVYLQLGSFSQLASAEARLKELVARFDSQKDAKLGIVNQEGNYRVRMGPFGSQAEAQKTAAGLNVTAQVSAS